jgi:putative ABC transport system permease protein
MHESGPPRLARWLLKSFLPEAAQAEILGDLEEEFHERSRSTARSWYWWQALRFSAFFLAQLMVDRIHSTAAALIERGHVGVRQTLRSLVRTPTFSLVVITMMAIGIGLNTAIFSFVYAILFRPFPYRDPAALVRVTSINQRNGNTTQSSWPDLEDWRAHNRTFTDLALYVAFQTDRRSSGPAESVRMAWVTPELFDVLGTAPVIGRPFRSDEGRVGPSAHKAIISHQFWQTAFGGRPDILGQSLNLPTTIYPIVGVMPPGFRFPDSTDIWIPMASGVALATEVDPERMRANRSWPVVGRLRPGVTVAQAEADLERIAKQLEASHPVANRDIRPVVTAMRDAEVGSMRPYLMLLLASVTLVLLLCCVNVANLFLSRSTARVREMSIRSALGASAGLIVRQLLIESLFLCGFAGILGVAVAAVTIRVLLSLIPVALPFWMRIDLDPHALLCTVLVSAITGVLFGLTPAWRVLRTDVSGSLRDRGGCSGTGPAGVRALLVVVEVAVSVALVATAGLLIRTFVDLQRANTGFDARAVVTAHISPFRPGTLADKQLGYSSLYLQIVRELNALSGVSSAAGVDAVPFRSTGSGRRSIDLSISAAPHSAERQATLFAKTASVSPGYFHTMAVPVVAGRDFTPHDVIDGEPVVILGERAAVKLFGSARDALDRAIRFERSSERPVWRHVVGVTGGVRYAAEDVADGFEIYLPVSQRAPGAFDFVVRSQGDSAAIVAAIRGAVARIDKDTAVAHVRTLASLVDDSLWQQRLSGFLLTSFAGVSLAVAALGLFEVMSYLVSLRTREIGIRLALGARRSAVLHLIVSRGLALTAAGLAIGLLLARLSAAWAAAALFGVSAADTATVVGVSLLFLAVAMLACAVPVWRVAHIDPSATLRHE